MIIYLVFCDTTWGDEYGCEIHLMGVVDSLEKAESIAKELVDNREKELKELGEWEHWDRKWIEYYVNIVSCQLNEVNMNEGLSNVGGYME